MSRNLRKRSAEGTSKLSSVIEISSDDDGDSDYELSKKRPKYDKKDVNNKKKTDSRCSLKSKKNVQKPTLKRSAKSKSIEAVCCDDKKKKNISNSECNSIKRKKNTTIQGKTKTTEIDVTDSDGGRSNTNSNIHLLDCVVDGSSSSSSLNSIGTKEHKNLNSHELYELVASNVNIDEKSAKNIIKMFIEENTLPFIYRYRRDMFNANITTEKLREIKCTYEEYLNLQKRINTVLKNLEKANILTDEIRKEIESAKTFDELEYLYAPYKSDKKSSLAERAKTLGLDVPAKNILYGTNPPISIKNLINETNTEMDTVEKILQHLCNAISHVFSKSPEILEILKKFQKSHQIIMKSTELKGKTSTKKNEVNKNKKNDKSKFENYFNFQMSINNIKPHQILAINRGEKLKFLSVKIIVSDYLKCSLKKFVHNLYKSQGIQYHLRNEIFDKSFNQCYNKKLQPLLCRQIRSALNKIATKASIDVFGNNLRQLLLTSPLKGEKILGIDPGFSNGCKLALISETANVLDTGIIYPHSNPDKSADILIKMLTKFNCKVIALGNGTACRNTEIWLSELFKNGQLDSSKIKYSIVCEQGASIYSCSDTAKEEFPDMDVNLISAVSIARRLNDPMSEYVKIEPRHIGVGMYQHDINENELNQTLTEVVTECVSFVGVDINTASINVLKYVAGLTDSRAKNIIEYRIKNGQFKTRKDLLNVKGIGPKTFTQCAGFIRIEPLSLKDGKVTEIFDCTWIHPECYDVAEKIIKKCGLNKENVGQSNFIEKIKEFLSKNPLENLEKEFKMPKERIKVVFDALQGRLFQDYRADIDKKPLFKQGITQMSDLKKGSIVTGAVTNLTHFGAFIDIGVERDGLIHNSKMKNSILNIGDRVEATVYDIDMRKNRISLKLEHLII